jgi:DNA uptake protein ComE-like DNA-binding protein
MALSLPKSRLSRFGTVLWALIPAWSFGLLAFVPFLHAAIKLRGARMWAVAAFYFALDFVIYVDIGLTDVNESADTASGLVTAVWIALIVVATVHALVLRRRVFAVDPAEALEDEPAVAAALAARERREEARALAAQDPALARDLRIGRPDLPREFDDGGLIDVNEVPERVLVERLGLSTAEAGRLVQTRERLGGFSSAEEVHAFAELPETTVNEIEDRLLFLSERPES